MPSPINVLRSRCPFFFTDTLAISARETNCDPGSNMREISVVLSSLPTIGLGWLDMMRISEVRVSARTLSQLVVSVCPAAVRARSGRNPREQSELSVDIGAQLYHGINWITTPKVLTSRRFQDSRRERFGGGQVVHGSRGIAGGDF